MGFVDRILNWKPVGARVRRSAARTAQRYIFTDEQRELHELVTQHPTELLSIAEVARRVRLRWWEPLEQPDGQPGRIRTQYVRARVDALLETVTELEQAARHDHARMHDATVAYLLAWEELARVAVADGS